MGGTLRGMDKHELHWCFTHNEPASDGWVNDFLPADAGFTVTPDEWMCSKRITAAPCDVGGAVVHRTQDGRCSGCRA